MKKSILKSLQLITLLFYYFIAINSATQKEPSIAVKNKIEEQAAFEKKIEVKNESLRQIILKGDVIDPKKLNAFKYFYFPKIQNSIIKNSEFLWAQIHDTLMNSGIIVSTSKTEFLIQGIDECKVATIKYSQEFISGPGIYSIIYFLNFEGDTIFFQYNQYKHKGSEENLSISMGNALNIFKNFKYAYSEELSKHICKKSISHIDNNVVKSQNEIFNTSGKYIANQNNNSNQRDEVNEVFNSEVDVNIPTIQNKFPNRFALIIGNEDYHSYQKGLQAEGNVIYAERDANIFRLYAINSLGIPEDNITLILNAKSIEMNRAIASMKLLSKISAGNAEIIFYYAGHGFPDEVTKEPYVIPVDVTSTDLKYALKLKDIYSELTEYPSKRVTVFLDACFSGGGRDQGLLASRGVYVKPNIDVLLKGDLVVFSSSSGNGTSLPYNEKQHGIFTYFLLKKIQESKGDITYEELSDFLIQKVSIFSALKNNKEQIPEVNFSYDIENEWKEWKLNGE